ncbi:uncharacterized protein LOC128550205 [Mercenaria mercenaria]|uniref:uncharacterized protein LOC128550205 n=1 Tax=Mercenaria mercenaria TaxID=6596 RepID=UPI00234F79FF|nr:uncharacterized protein LOC128550205 [Mercenaria mercenaria]
MALNCDQLAAVEFISSGLNLLLLGAAGTDECSMLSKNFFECLNEVCKLKDENQHFGGIQLLLSGDFRQLLPVPNHLYGEQGEFCFESKLFSEVLPHRITLTTVVRQSEKDLIHAIHEVSAGILSAETALFIESLQRPLKKDRCIKLFSTNEQVEDYNRQCTVDFPGELYEYKSTDEGDRKYLNKILAPQTLWLKKETPVMLLRNLSDKLVNGLQGTVIENGPIVEFSSLNMKLPMGKIKFSVFSPTMNTDVTVRVQYQIKLSFAISIHKSQGLTLDW